MFLNQKIRRLTHGLKKKYHTSDPFELIDYLVIERFEGPLGNLLGCYMMIKRSKCIFINSDIELECVHKIVCAHELGHAIQHPKINCNFIGDRTLYSKSKIEIEANTFAAELLLPDDIEREYPGMTVDQIAAQLGVVPELIKLKY